MGFLDKISGIVTGIGGAAQSIVGIPYDLTRAAFTDSDDIDGLFPTLWVTTTVRGGDLLGNLFGPHEGVGAAISLLPEQVGPRPLLRETFEDIERYGQEYVREPLATMMTVGSLADSPTWEAQGGTQGMAGLFDPDSWRKAHEIAQTRSVGQAVALAIGTKDILDGDEVANFVNTDFYTIASGTTDAAVRWFLDPDALASRIPTFVRAARTTKIGTFTAPATPRLGGRFVEGGPKLAAVNDAIRKTWVHLPEGLQRTLGGDVYGPGDLPRLLADEAERLKAGRPILGIEALARQRFAADLDVYMGAPARADLLRGRLFGTRTWSQIEDWMARLDTDIGSVTDAANIKTARIRDALFPNHAHGDIISSFLAQATSRSEREQMMRLWMGDLRAADRLQATDYALGQRLKDLATDRGLIQAEIGPNSLLGSRRAAREGQLSLAEALDDRRNYEGRLARISEEMKAIVSEQARLDRLDAATRTIAADPVLTMGNRARIGVKRSHLYQKMGYGGALRVFTDMAPHHLLDLNDSKADALFDRMLGQAGFDQTKREAWRGRFANETVDGRLGVFNEAIEAAETSILKEYGVTQVDLETLRAQASRGRDGARGHIQGSRFDAQDRALIEGFDGEMFEYPFRVTELANVVTVTNFSRLRKEAERYARLQYGTDWRATLARGTKPAYTALGFGHALMADITSVWKPTVLLRPAWTIRVVILDEQVRQLVKFGTLATLLGKRGALNGMGNRLRRQPTVARWLSLDDATRATRVGAVTGAIGGALAAGPVGALIGGATTAGLLRALSRIEQAGLTNLTVNSYKAATHFGAPNDTARLYRDQVSAGQGIHEFFAPIEGGLTAKLRPDPSAWRNWTHGESARGDIAHRKAWNDLMVRVFNPDPLTRQALEGRSVDELVEWLTETPEGLTHAQRFPGRKGDEEAWATNLVAQVDDYTASNPEVAAAVLGGDPKAIDAAYDAMETKPVIHGPEIEQIVGKGPVKEAIDNFVRTSFEVLGTMATDELSRNPTFAMFYRAELHRLLGPLPPGRITERQLHRFEDAARRFALGETRTLLYDLAERSEFANMTRILLPFYPAFQEVLTRWAGLVWENPRLAVSGAKIYNAPNRAGMVYTDDQGEQYLTFRLPTWAKGLVNASPLFSSAVDDQGYVRMAKDGFNLVMSGTPGFGPFAQLAVSEAVKQRPELEEAVRFIIPFGPVEGVEAFLPAAAKRLVSLNQQEEDASYASALNRIMLTRIVKMDQGELNQVDFSDPIATSAFIAEAKAETNALFNLRLVAAFVSPVAPIFDSPYRPYIDIYRAIQRGDTVKAAQLVEEAQPGSARALGLLSLRYGRDADAIFYDLFGAEFYALTQSFTKANDGVPPTLEGLAARTAHRDLVERYPEWGAVITGNEGGGLTTQFSRAAYDRQLTTPLREGSDLAQRQRLAPEQIVTGPDVREGWMLYSRYMDRITFALEERGLPNLNVKAAEDLRAYKHAVILALASQHPRWFEDFSVTDRGTWDRRLEGARALAADSTLNQRPDISGLRDYLAFRDLITGLLEQRETKTLRSVANQDLAYLWDTVIHRLVETQPAFADLWARKLEHDPVAS